MPLCLKSVNGKFRAGLALLREGICGGSQTLTDRVRKEMPDLRITISRKLKSTEYLIRFQTNTMGRRPAPRAPEHSGTTGALHDPPRQKSRNHRRRRHLEFGLNQETRTNWLTDGIPFESTTKSM